MRKDLTQLFEEFLYESEFVRKIRPQTLRAYKNTFSLLIKLIPGLSLSTLSTFHITEFFRILEERRRITGKGAVKIGIKKSTIATYWKKLNAFFQWLVVKRYNKTNPLASLS